MNAYSEGVNAWIAQMRPRDLPLEYRLLGARPMQWKAFNSLLFLSRMSLTLGLNDATTRRLGAQALVGKAAADALFPLHSPIQEPIQPNGQKAPRYDFGDLPDPGAPDSTARIAAGARLEILASLGVSLRGAASDAIGSNNWAVSPSRSTSHAALLAGDPHLDLSLPSVWYEMHIVVPGEFDVAGAGFPGMPGVVIGFNRDVAWTFTNTGSDVDDFYEETVDDPAHPGRYMLDGTWRPLVKRIERYRDKNGSLLATDTLLFTHRGPMRKLKGRWLSMRWTAQQPSHEPDNFLRLARTHSAGEWLDSMQDFVAPTQNGLVADRGGNIAIRSSGVFPVRPGDGRGDVIRDGSLSSNDWTGILPVSKYPFSMNPAQGYLASANQEPIDPRENSSFMGSDWYSPWRAMRINELLRADSSVTPDDMRRFQTDPGSARADAFVPLFLAAAAHADSDGSATPSLREAAKLLAQWDRRYTKDNRRAMLFEAAMTDLMPRLWDELTEKGDKNGTSSFNFPEAQTVIELARTPKSIWWDDRRTPIREDRNAIFAASLAAGYAKAVSDHGPPESSGWLWSNNQQANIRHLLGIPALSALRIPVQGGASTLSPSSGRGGQGASWRMVVELGDTLRAWAIFPGGQSGDPASNRYTDRLSRWESGELDEVLFPRSAKEIDRKRIISTLTLVPR
jgi:penicillin amidase